MAVKSARTGGINEKANCFNSAVHGLKAYKQSMQIILMY